MATETKLWAILIPGPDDVWAMPSESSAIDAAAKHNAAVDSSMWPPEIPRSACYASVIEWPYDAESHARALLEDEPTTLSSNDLGIQDGIVDAMGLTPNVANEAGQTARADTISISTLATLAGKWQAEADAHVTSPSTYGTARRETLRECADALRMLCEVRFEDCPQQDAQR